MMRHRLSILRYVAFAGLLAMTGTDHAGARRLLPRAPYFLVHTKGRSASGLACSSSSAAGRRPTYES